jgi:hypothetical protein
MEKNVKVMDLLPVKVNFDLGLGEGRRVILMGKFERLAPPMSNS